MRITFLGAAGEVTGSSYLVETAHARVLVDFGMFQGARDDFRRNIVPEPLDPRRLDAVVITHAHNDHVGRLPLLPAAGFAGPIHLTQASAELAALMLRDAGHIQETDTLKLNRIRAARGKPPITPLFTAADVEKVLPHFKLGKLGAEVPVAEGVSARWLEAGHILGSASILLTLREGPRVVRVCFSGDLGPLNSPILRDFTPPAQPPAIDHVILESTYGDRDHRSPEATLDELASIVQQAVTARAKVIIPAFAVGRTQTLVFQLGQLARAGRIPKCPVIIDSPMAIEAVQIYARHTELHDAETRQIVKQGHHPLELPGLEYSRSTDDSRRLNTLPGPAIIIAGSGMATGGRILHHLRHNLPREDAHILFVGFQARGSLGRQLVDGARAVRLFGEDLPVRARVHTLNGLSAHAGQSDLLAWAAHFNPDHATSPEAPRRWPTFTLTHGEDAPRQALAAALSQRFGLKPAQPRFGDTATL